MQECVKTIDNMDISDNEKVNLHKNIHKEKELFLESIGNLIANAVKEDISPYVEHTHKGLNLRIVPKNQQTVKEVKAIADYAGLNKIQENKTNPENSQTWLRFTVE